MAIWHDSSGAIARHVSETVDESAVVFPQQVVALIAKRMVDMQVIVPLPPVLKDEVCIS